MYNGVKSVLIFTLGAAAGSVATWWFLKDKYEKYDNGDPTEDYEAVGPDDITDECKQEYSDILEDYEGGMNKREKGGSDTMKNGSDPVTIPPDEFGEDEDYDTEYLNYYNDGVLADDCDIPIEDVDAVVGLDSLEQFGEWEDDIVHVRNDRLRTYYEITQDARNYSDVVGGNLNLRDD